MKKCTIHALQISFNFTSMKRPSYLYFFSSIHSSNIYGVSTVPQMLGDALGTQCGLGGGLCGVHIWGRKSDPGQVITGVQNDRRHGSFILRQVHNLFLLCRRSDFLPSSLPVLICNLLSTFPVGKNPTGRLAHPISEVPRENTPIE